MHPLIQVKDGQMFASIQHIDIDGNFNIRKEMGDLDSLSADIKQNGIRIPVEIRIVAVGEDAGDSMLFLVDGHRRIAAAKKLGGKEFLVPVQFEKEDSKPIDRLVSMFVRNTGKPLEPMEEQELFQRMIDLHFKPKDIARKIGRTLDYVNGRLSLGKASEEVKAAIKEKKITVGAARALAKKPKADQDKALKAAKETAGGKKLKAGAVKEAAGIKSMRTEKEIRIRLNRYGGARLPPREIGYRDALAWVLGGP